MRVKRQQLLQPTRTGSGQAKERDMIASDIATKQLLIDGAWTNAADGKTYENRNPATNEAIAAVADAGRADVDLAVAAARRAFTGGKWPAFSASRRGKMLYKIAQLIA